LRLVKSFDFESIVLVEKKALLFKYKREKYMLVAGY